MREASAASSSASPSAASSSALLKARLASGAPAGLTLAWNVRGECCWLHADSRRDDCKLELKASPGAGVGVFALADVEPGERLLAERPLLEWRLAEFTRLKQLGRHREAMEAAVRRLSAADRDAFYDLCMTCPDENAAFGVWLSNAFPTEDEPESAAVFRVASRFNHSCRCNAHYHYNTRSHRMTVQALVRVAAGEEVKVGYTGGENDVRAARRADLQRDFGFECRCALCTLDGAAFAESEARQRRIRQLSDAITAHPCPPNVVSLVEEKLGLMAKEGSLASWDTMECAMQYLELTGDPQRARLWAARAAENAHRALGEDSSEYESLLAKCSTTTKRGVRVIR